jgi:trigger factor
VEKNFLKKEKNIEKFIFYFTPEEVEKAEGEVVKYVNQHYSIPGFRKGKVPVSIVRNFLDESFDEMVLENLSDTIEKEIKEEKLYIPASIVSQKREGDVASIEVELHREPELKIKDFGELELMIPIRDEVVANYVSNRLEELRNEHAIIEPKDGPVEIGDMAKIEYSIIKDGKKIADKKVQEVQITAEDDRPMVKNLIGHSRGDTIQFNRTFEGSDNEYFYSIELNEVFKKSLPEIDDEFARTVDPDLSTLDELKKKIEEEGVKSFAGWKKDFLRQQAMDKIDDLVEIEIAESTIGFFVQRAIENSKKDKSYDGYLKQAESLEKLVEEFRTGIINEVKKNRFIEEMARIEGLKVEEDELVSYSEEMSSYWGMSADRAREMIKSREDIREDLTSTILRNKVLDIVVERAKVVEIEPKKEAPEQSEQKEKE